jgi:O-antigen ligase
LINEDGLGVERVTTAEAEIESASAANIVTAKKSNKTLEAAIFWLFVGGLGWVPFWNGSNELVSWGINAILFPGLAAVYEVLLLIRGESHPIAVRVIALPAGLFAAVTLWTFFQTLGWPHSAVAHPIWEMVAGALGRPTEGSISVNPDLTNLALLRLITAAAVFWTALQLCRSGFRATLLVRSLAAIGCAYAAYGLIALGVPIVRLPWLGDVAERGMVSSTFVNRNSYATYAGLGLMAIAGLTLRLYVHQIIERATKLRLAVAAAIETAGGKGATPLTAGFLISVALLLTGSRGGVSAAGLGLVVLAVLASKHRKRRAMLGVAIILGSLSVAALLVEFGDPVGDNLRERGISDTNRVSAYLLTIRSILDIPLLGYGYGTFADVFPMYRDRSLSVYGTWEQAHDTYLEIFQGLGLMFGSMLVMSVFLLVLRCIKSAMMMRRGNATVPGVAAAAAVLVGGHALVDFSLQIQAVALTFAAMLGAGVAQAESGRSALRDYKGSARLFPEHIVAPVTPRSRKT